jgi:hypothetical protein
MLRHEASVSSVADASCLSMTVKRKQVLILKGYRYNPVYVGQQLLLLKLP